MQFAPFIQQPSPDTPKRLIKRGFEGMYELNIYRYFGKISDFSNRPDPNDWDAVEKLLLRALEDVQKIKENNNA